LTPRILAPANPHLEERTMSDPCLVPTESAWPAHPAAVAYVERELADQLWLAEAGFPVNEDRPSPIVGLYLASWLAVLADVLRPLWRQSRWHRRTAIPPVFYWNES